MRRRSPLPGLGVANGVLTVVTAIAFAIGDYGAFRPQDSGGFRTSAGLLVAFSAIAFVAFVAGAVRGRVPFVVGLAAVTALIYGALVLSPFHVPQSLLTLAILTSLLVILAGAAEMLSPKDSHPGGTWASGVALLGAAVGGVGVLAIGRYEFGADGLDFARLVGLAVAIAGLALFATGASAVASGTVRATTLLIALTAALAGGAVVIGARDLDREGVGFGTFAAVGTPWSASFWLVVAATLIAATASGAGAHRRAKQV